MSTIHIGVCIFKDNMGDPPPPMLILKSEIPPYHPSTLLNEEIPP